MKFQSFARRVLAGSLACSLFIGALPKARADDSLWETTKDYTMTVAKAGGATAAAVLTAAKAALDLAKANLDQAKAALDLAKAGGSIIVIGEATTAVGLAEAAVAAAVAAYGAAVTAAGVAAAVIAGATIGTGLGQGANWVLSWCWDPVCDLTPMQPGDGPIYYSASQEEVDRLIPQVVFLATGQEFEIPDRDSPSYRLISQQIHLFLGLSRGAAAYTEGRADEVMQASNDLKEELRTLPNTILEFSDALQETKLVNPLTDLGAQREKFESAIQTAILALKEGRNRPDVNPEEVDITIGHLNDSLQYFREAYKAVQDVQDLTLVGEGGLLKGNRLADYDQFLSDCDKQGKACLPKLETDIVNFLMDASGVYSPTVSDYGVEIAAWDAHFGHNDLERSIHERFEAQGGMTVADVLRTSVLERSTKGYWMNSDFEQSPLTIWARAMLAKGGNQEDSGKGGCSLVAGLDEIPNGANALPFLLFAVAGLITRLRFRKRDSE
ncbi:MAG: hypothetical protein K8R69_03030 [Deltaproteobacteria bacterium]|nr:hypothetical protein [Deltaproteobacteria bacterium]